MRKRIAYALLGCALGAVLVLPLCVMRARRHRGFVTSPAIAFCICCGTLATWIAERKGKVKSVSELRQPITLFPPDAPKA